MKFTQSGWQLLKKSRKHEGRETFRQKRMTRLKCGAYHHREINAALIGTSPPCRRNPHPPRPCAAAEGEREDVKYLVMSVNIPRYLATSLEDD
jgi:hypothetical protein